jgi:hypothetical protein
MRKIAFVCLGLCLGLCISFLAYAGGNPHQVKFPDGYKTEFKKYDTRNRVGKPQIAVLYANQVALDSLNKGKLADGSKIVMEVYKAEVSDGEPVTGSDGIYQKGKLAAIAVMEKRSDWNGIIDDSGLAGDWGFAIYNTDGKPKENGLDCASCHTPMPESDFLFSHATLLEFSK